MHKLLHKKYKRPVKEILVQILAKKIFLNSVNQKIPFSHALADINSPVFALLAFESVQDDVGVT